MDSLIGGSGADTFDILAGATLTNGLVGGAGDDRFNLFGDISGTVDGGLGADVFNIHNSDMSASISGGEEVADDNSVVDVVTGFQDRNTTWNIAADGTQSIDGSVDDSLDYSDITDPLNVRLGSNLDGVSGIEQLVGNGLTGSTLTLLDDLPGITDAERGDTTNHYSQVVYSL